MSKKEYRIPQTLLVALLVVFPCMSASSQAVWTALVFACRAAGAGMRSVGCNEDPDVSDTLLL